MKVITHLGIEGVANFKKSVLPIAPGVTYLYGYNELDNGNANAAGKSVLASAAAEIFYDTPMVGVKQDRSKFGARSIRWKEKKKSYSVQSVFEGKTERLRYRIDGQPAENRKVTLTRAAVRKAWGLSEEDYRTYGYLDSATPHPLVRGTTAARKAFFTSFFQLDRLDEEKKLIAKRASELKKLRAQHTELDKTFREVKDDMLSKAKREELELKLAKLKKTAKRLRAEADKAQRAKSIADFKKWAAPHLPAFQKLVPDLADYDKVCAATRKALKLARAAEEQAEEYRDYQVELRAYKKKIEGLDMSVPIEDLEKRAASYEKAKASLELLESQLEDVGSAPEEVSEPKTDKAELQARLYAKRHELDHVRKFKKGVCGECGQAVKTRAPAVIEEEIEKLETKIKQWSRFEKYEAALVEWKKATKKAKAARAAIAEAQSVIEKTKKAAKLYKARAGIEKPAAVAKPENLGDVKALTKQAETLAFFADHLDMLTSLDEPTVEPFDLDKLDRIQSTISDIEGRLKVHNTVKTRASKIRARLQEIEAQLVDESSIELLLDAYSAGAAKKMAVDEISKHLMKAINRYGKIVFKGYRFEFVWGSQVQFLVHRAKSQPTDVRRLCGAESKLFTLILVLSLLMFVPRSKRLSLLVLDEPSASLSKESLAKFHAMLPHLMQLIPSILIVTPKSEERFAGAAEYTVYRDHTGAEIRKGHPNEF